MSSHFAGRSNVGKSSLLNALTGRKALARVSHQPGRTRQLNFFKFELAAPIVLVDMPGYGYAEAPKGDQARLARPDAGLPARPAQFAPGFAPPGRPGGAENLPTSTVLELLDQAAVVYQLVLTKADAVKPQALARKKQAEIGALAAANIRRR